MVRVKKFAKSRMTGAKSGLASPGKRLGNKYSETFDDVPLFKYVGIELYCIPIQVPAIRHHGFNVRLVLMLASPIVDVCLDLESDDVLGSQTFYP